MYVFIIFAFASINLLLYRKNRGNTETFLLFLLQFFQEFQTTTSYILNNAQFIGLFYLLKFDVRQIVFKLKLVNTPRSFLLLKKEKVPTRMTCIFQLA